MSCARFWESIGPIKNKERTRNLLFRRDRSLGIPSRKANSIMSRIQPLHRAKLPKFPQSSAKNARSITQRPNKWQPSSLKTQLKVQTTMFLLSTTWASNSKTPLFPKTKKNSTVSVPLLLQASKNQPQSKNRPRTWTCSTTLRWKPQKRQRVCSSKSQRK